MTQDNPQLQMDKLVFVKELRSGVTKNGKSYPIVCDQDNELWYIFNDVNLLISGR